MSSSSKTHEWINTHGTTHSARMMYILKNGISSDVSLIVGKEKECFCAIKALLMAASSVFDDIFTADPTKEEFEIPEIEPHVFRMLLKFIYTGECSQESKDAIPLLNAAKFYVLPDLEYICSNILKDAYKKKNAFVIFEQATRYKEKNLKEEAKKEISRNASELVESAEFMELSSDCLEKLLRMDDLAVKDEVQLFKALWCWAEAECRRQNTIVTPKYLRSVLENLIPHIRFPLMDPGEFSLEVYSRNILTENEIISVFAYYNIPKFQRSSLLPHSISMFNLNPRKYKLPTVHCNVDRLVTCDEEEYLSVSKKWHRICFRASDKIWLTSIGLNRNMKEQEDEKTYSVKIKLEDSDMETTFGVKTEIVEAKNNNTNIQIKFDKPIKIQQNIWYTASLRVQHEDYEGVQFKNNNVTSDTYSVLCKGSGNNYANIEFKNCDSKDSNEETYIEAGQMANLGFLLY